MGNNHNMILTTFQVSIVPSMPQMLPYWGLQTSYCYCPTSTMHANPLVTLATAQDLRNASPLLFNICSKLHPPLAITQIMWQYLLVCMGQQAKVAPFSLPPNTSYYFHVVVSNLPLQRLPNGMFINYLFLNEMQTYHLKEHLTL